MNKIFNIMIIEDNECLLTVMTHFFGKRYQVTPTKNGLDAMRQLCTGVLPDLILLDWDMPVMNGETFLEGIRTSNFYKDIPVILLSGSVPLQELQNTIAEGYFSKPFDPNKVNQQIQLTL